MKRTLHIFAVAALTLATAACQKEQASNSGENTVTINFSASEIQTKTVFGEKTDNKYPTLWTENQKVGIVYNSGVPTGYTVTPSSDKKTASFEAAFSKDDKATSHNFYVVSPDKAFLGFSSKGANIEIPSAQSPLDGTCDELAQIIISSHISETFDTDIELAFSHITAYGNLTVTMPSDAGAISSISLTASAKIAGRFFYNFENASFSENSASNTITLKTDKVSDIFFACAPADLSGGSLDVTVTAENGTYEKSIDLTGKTLKFEAGKVSKFSVKDFTKKDTDEVYTLVTDASSLKLGDKIIIAAAGSDVAMSTTQNSNNRGQAAITKNGNTIVNPGSNVQLFTLEEGTVTGTYAFNTGSGYIYAASSSSNQLNVQDAIDANASWSISCTEKGIATIKANGANTRNNIRYNNTSKLFSCYALGQADVAIYTDGKGTFTPKIVLSPEEATVDCNVTETSFNVSSNTSWTVSSDADWAKLTTNKGIGNAEVRITLDQNTGTTSRTAKFTIESEDKTITKSFTLTQNAFEPKLELDTDNATVLASATEATFKVISNTDWKVSTDSGWALCTEEEGSKNGTVDILFDENTGAERTATFTVTTTDGSLSNTFTLTQKAAGATTAKTYTLSFPDSSDKGVQNYTTTWEANRDNFVWTLVNWNNNNKYNNNWTYIKAGSKNNTSIAIITTNTTIPEAISAVTMTITEVTAASINSIKLEVLSGDTIKETITGTAAVGDCVFKIANPQKDCKYKITIDCKKGSKNGLISVSKVVYTE